MELFTYRDARLTTLTRALAALGEAASELREPLEKELATLQTGDWRVTDRAYQASAEDFLWATTLTLKLSVDEDPALAALGEAARLTDAQAAAVETIPRTPGGPPSDFLMLVKAALGGDEAVFTELIHTGHWRWLGRPDEERQYVYDDIGVILPLRLETIFDAPGEGETQWKLSLRVLPDEASIRRDNPNVSQDEIVCLREFWQWQYTGADEKTRRADINRSPVDWLDDEGGKVAWSHLCAQLGATRAAWAIAEFLPGKQGDVFDITVAPERIGKPESNRVAGMPSRLEVSVSAGGRHHLIGTLEVKTDRLKLLLPDPQSPETWLTSWELARDVGMGGDWPLPNGVTPENIEALYVIGIGDESPDELFRAHAHSGELSVVPLGSPTNTIHGAEAADLTKDAESWRETAKQRLKTNLGEMVAIPRVKQRIGDALLSNSAVLPFIPGVAARDDTDDARRIARALWPTLWGHWMFRLWKLGDDTYRVMKWAIDHLYPEGPLMPIRIANQPYGLLPTTSLSQWQSEPAANPSDGKQSEIEQGLAHSLAMLRAKWAAAARSKGNVVGQLTSRFVELLGRNALSANYITRMFFPYHVFADVYQFDRDRFLERALESYKLAIDYMRRRPGVPFVTGGYYTPVELPLIKPSRMPEKRFENDVTQFKVDDIITGLLQGRGLEGVFHRENRTYILPDSLLIRLMVHATQISQRWRHQLQGQTADLVIFDSQEKSVRELAREFDESVEKEKLEPHGEPIMALKMAPERIAQLERALRATLDATSHRIDPWIVGFAWQRLNRRGRGRRKNPRLGVYGWVDGPFIGQPGPTEAGRLHAPSNAQALAGLILRDKYLSTRNEPHAENGHQPWAMNLNSRNVRLAEEIAEEARMGFHVDEIIGRRVEAVVGDQKEVRRLRTDARYAMYPERINPNEVCNGREALSELLNPRQQLIALTTEQRAALQLLSDALDAYADLLMADAGLQLVNRQVACAAELMDAASGFSRPPTFEFTRTPPSGYQLETRVLTVFPYVNVSALADDATPATLADPSLAAFLETNLGSNWRWIAENENGQQIEVFLHDLGLKPIDSVAVSDEFLRDAARARLGLPDAKIIAPEQHRLARQLVAQLGVQPLVSRDFSEVKSPSDRTPDQTIYAELVERYRRLRAACERTIAAFDQAADVPGRLRALRQALSWGVVPVADPADHKVYFNALFSFAPAPPTIDEALGNLVKKAKDALKSRVDAAPEVARLIVDINVPPEPNAVSGIPDGIMRMARAIAELASPDGKLSVLAAWPKAELLNRSGVKNTEPDASLDEDWLSVIAPVRPPMARFEALQLEASQLRRFPAFKSWSNSPGDPWQTELAKANSVSKESPLNLGMDRFVAAYGHDGAWEGETVAVGLLDSFSEAIPLPQRRTTVAFGFNAPAARPPQAILLAVPPTVRQRLDHSSLCEIVRETRELSHARAARLEDLGKLSALSPTIWLQVADVRLEPWPLFQP